MKVVFFQEEPRPGHLAGSSRQVELAFLAGKDIFVQHQDHIALDPGYFRGLIDLHLLRSDAAVSLADFHLTFGGIEVVGGIIGNRVGADPPRPPSKRWPLNRSISVAAPALPTLRRKIRHPKVRIKLRANINSWKSVPKPLNHTIGLRLFQGSRLRRISRLQERLS